MSSITKYRPDHLSDIPRLATLCNIHRYPDDERSIAAILGNNWAALQTYLENTEENTDIFCKTRLFSELLFSVYCNAGRCEYGPGLTGYYWFINQDFLPDERLQMLDPVSVSLARCENPTSPTPTTTISPCHPTRGTRPATRIIRQFSLSFMFHSFKVRKFFDTVVVTYLEHKI